MKNWSISQSRPTLEWEEFQKRFWFRHFTRCYNKLVSNNIMNDRNELDVEDELDLIIMQLINLTTPWDIESHTIGDGLNNEKWGFVWTARFKTTFTQQIIRHIETTVNSFPGCWIASCQSRSISSRFTRIFAFISLNNKNWVQNLFSSPHQIVKLVECENLV